MSRRKRRRNERNAELRNSLKHKQATLRYLRVAPRKVRAVADVIRGKRVEDALAILDFTHRAAAAPMARMLRAALANCATSDSIDVDALRIKVIHVDQGPTIKRFMPRAQGRATMIQKKTSHISVVLEETES
jgi:large subunit ribosomal protein L22